MIFYNNIGNADGGEYYTASKNDTDVPHYNFDADQPLLIIFGS